MNPEYIIILYQLRNKMANIFLEAVTYTNVTDVRASTLNATLADITPIVTDDQVNILIRKAEIIIDSIVGSYGEPVSDTQVSIFPATVDSVSIGIPLDVQKAAIILVEAMYVDGVLGGITASISGSVAGNIIKEKYGIHEFNYSDSSTASGKRFSANDNYINDEIYTLLKPYISSGKSTFVIPY